MDFEYQTRPLIDCAKLLSGGTPSKSNPEYWNGDIPWITPKDMADWNGGTADHVTAAAVGNGTRLAPAFASYIAVRGMSLHNEIRVVRPSFPATFNQDIKAIQALDGVDGRFLYYCLVAHKPTLLDKVESAGHGTGKLPTDQLENLPIPKVDDDIATGVAKILGDLDDKIDLLREMNRTLEDIARAVFHAWFVDFEPIRAKAAGANSFRGMPQDLFDSLPAEFEDSVLGAIPEGWKVEALGHLVQLRNDRIKAGHETEALPYVPIDSIDARSIFLMQEKHGSEAQSSLVRIYPNDILFGAMRPYFHKVCISPFEATTRTTVFVVMPRVVADLYFSLMILSEDKTVEFATTSSIGSTIPYAKWEGVLERMQIVLPPAPLRKAFGEFVAPLIERGMRAKAEVEALASIRDTLLPKLISGELPAPGLEVLGLKAVGDGG